MHNMNICAFMSSDKTSAVTEEIIETCVCIQNQCFDKNWSSDDFKGLLKQSGYFCATAEQGYLLFSLVGEEAEIISLGVSPDFRRKGLGAKLISDMCDFLAQKGASRCFLEVSASNAPALALYRKSGFEQIGSRPRYYLKKDGSREDAFLMAKLF